MSMENPALKFFFCAIFFYNWIHVQKIDYQENKSDREMKNPFLFCKNDFRVLIKTCMGSTQLLINAVSGGQIMMTHIAQNFGKLGIQDGNDEGTMYDFHNYTDIFGQILYYAHMLHASDVYHSYIWS